MNKDERKPLTTYDMRRAAWWTLAEHEPDPHKWFSPRYYVWTEEAMRAFQTARAEMLANAPLAERPRPAE